MNREPLVLKGRDGTAIAFEQRGEDLHISLRVGGETWSTATLRAVYFFRDGNLYGPELLQGWLAKGGEDK